MSVVGERLAERVPLKHRDAPVTARTAAYAVAAIVVVAALIRFLGLTRQSIWVDESSTIAFTQRGLSGMLHLLVHYEANALLYYVLVYPLSLLDGGVGTLRALSALAGVAAIPALYWSARLLVPRFALLVACGALSLNAFAVTQSQNARPYALAMLMAILSYGALSRACAHGERRNWLIYVAATVVVIYLNSLCGLLLVAAQVFLPLAAGRQMIARWLAAVVAIVAAAAPVAALVAHAGSERDPFYWVRLPGPYELARAQALVFGGVAAAACTGAVILCALALARHRLPRTPAALLSHPATPVAAWAFGPIVLLFGLSLMQPVFSEKYLTIAVPGVCLALGLALASLPSPARGWATAVVLASLAVGVGLHARGQYLEDWRTPIRQLAALRAPGDPVIFDTQLGVVPAGYYEPQFTSAGGRLFISEWGDGPLPANVAALGNPGADSGLPVGPPSVQLVQRLAARTGRLFLVISHTTGQGDVLAAPGLRWLDDHCTTGVHHYKAVTLVTATGCSQ